MKTIKIKKIQAKLIKKVHKSGVMNNIKLKYNHLGDIVEITNNSDIVIFVFDNDNKVIYFNHAYVIRGLLRKKKTYDLLPSELDSVTFLIEITINDLLKQTTHKYRYNLDYYSAYYDYSLLKK